MRDRTKSEAKITHVQREAVEMKVRTMIERIDDSLASSPDLIRYARLLREARHTLADLELLVLDLLMQNPDFKAHADLRARLNATIG
jgi:hypothetical protein